MIIKYLTNRAAVRIEYKQHIYGDKNHIMINISHLCMSWISPFYSWGNWVSGKWRICPMTKQPFLVSQLTIHFHSTATIFIQASLFPWPDSFSWPYLGSLFPVFGAPSICCFQKVLSLLHLQNFRGFPVIVDIVLFVLLFPLFYLISNITQKQVTLIMCAL